LAKVLTIIGTRPEVIKTAVLQSLLANDPDIEAIYCSTGQHKELLHSVLVDFAISLDVELDAMAHNQSLSHQISYIMISLQKVIDKEVIDLIIVQGDTLSAYCGAMIAFYNKIKIAHVEAGLRTGNKNGPYPEEIHRKYIDDVADIHFAHSEMARQTLLTEGHLTDTVYMTGNTGIDALLSINKLLTMGNLSPAESIKNTVKKLKQTNSKLALLTLHRRETSGSQQIDILEKILACAKELDMQIMMLIHPNPMLRDNLSTIDGSNRIELVNPLAYSSFVWLMTQVDIIYTDSGGIQEEAPYLGKRVIVLRGETERQEAVEDDTNRLYNAENLVTATSEILAAEEVICKPYGDGNASNEIVRIIKKFTEPGIAEIRI